jgi:hypothetical protein
MLLFFLPVRVVAGFSFSLSSSSFESYPLFLFSLALICSLERRSPFGV